MTFVDAHHIGIKGLPLDVIRVSRSVRIEPILIMRDQVCGVVPIINPMFEGLHRKTIAQRGPQPCNEALSLSGKHAASDDFESSALFS